jgi:hypothetical protein
VEEDVFLLLLMVLLSPAEFCHYFFVGVEEQSSHLDTSNGLITGNYMCFQLIFSTWCFTSQVVGRKL